MGLFTGTGDFFRGVFGESAEEKRRRKLREAQEAAARKKQAAQAKPQAPKDVVQLFAKPTQAPRPEQPQAKPVVRPVVQAAPRVSLPPPTPKVTPESLININKTPPKTKPIDPQSATAKTNRVVTSVADSTARVTTGIASALPGLYDLVTPGKGRNRMSKAADQVAKEIDRDAKKNGNNAVYKTGNVVGEVASYLIPTKAAIKVASLMPKGQRITADAAESIAKRISDPKGSSALRRWLAEGVRKGMTMEELIADQAITAKYIGENASKGNDTSPTSVAADVALGAGGTVLGGLLSKTARLARKGRLPDPEEVVEDVAGSGTAAATAGTIREGGSIVKDWFQNKQQPSVEDVRVARELGENPNFGKKEMSEAERRYREQESARRAEGDQTPAFAKDAKETYDQVARDYVLKNGVLDDAEYARRRQAILAQVSKEQAQVRSGIIKITNEQELIAFKKRHLDMLKELETHKKLSDEMVENARRNNEAAVKGKQGEVETAQAAQAAATTPNPEDVVQGAPELPDPEIQANNSYADASTGVLDAVGINPGEAKRGNLLYNNPISKLFNKVQQGYVEKVNETRDAASEMLQGGIQGKNGVTRGTNEVARAFFKNFGQSDAVRDSLIKRTSHIQNAGRVATHALKTIEDEVAKIGNPAQVYERIYRVLEEPEFLERVFGDATKLTVDDLTPAERAVFSKLVELNKIRNKINFQTGVINRDQYFAFEDGMHSPRIYDINVEHPELKDFVASSRYQDLKAGIQRKDIKDIPDYVLAQLVDSPFQASALRLETALKNLANDEALGNLDATGALLTKAPNKNFVPLEGKKYGKYEGKYIDKQLLSQIDGKDYYNSEVGQRVGDAIDSFHNSILGAPGRAYKQFRTVFSPGTFVGNVGSGQMVFSGAANINPVTSVVRTAQAAKQLASKDINANVQEAELAGLFAGNTGRQITHSKEAESAIREGKKGFTNTAKDVYGGVDKATALGWYNELRARGLTPEQAVQRVHLGMQNYDNAGRVINALSDSPVLGKPFARFTPELLRILKNNIFYNPVGTATKVGAGIAGANYMVDQAGETPEERKSREEAPGQTKIGPVSLNIPVPDKIDAFGKEIDLPGEGSAVNVARVVGLNFPQEPNSNPNQALVRQLSPVADLDRKNAQGETVFAPNQVVSDMFYRQFADQAVNRDFMGRQITDPTNKTYFENGDASVRKYAGEPSDNEQLKNRAKAFSMGLPGAPELDNLFSAYSKKEDYYGKERTPVQSWMRVFGLKAEKNDKATREKRVETQRYFDEDLDAIQQFVQKNPDLADTYFKLRSPTRTRPQYKDDPGTKTSDLVSPEKWKLIHSDTTGRLYNFLKEQAVKQSAEDSTKPLDPLYQLPPEEAKYVLELRSRPTGDDVEAQDILRATSTWYADYEKRYHDYLTKNNEWFDKLPKNETAARPNQRVADYEKVSPPVEQPPIIAEYMRIKAADPVKAKEVYKANKDALSAAFDAYAVQKLNRINALRRIEGYEPIALDVYKNKTFGFDMDDGSGFGFGRGGGGGRQNDVNMLGNISDFVNDVQGIDPIEAQAMPNLVAIFQKLRAGEGGGRSKPKIGASARGQ